MDLRRSTMTGPHERLKPAGDCSDGPPCDLLALADNTRPGPRHKSALRAIPQEGKIQLDIERHGSTRISLHQIDCVTVSGRDPPELLEDHFQLQGLQEGDLESAGLVSRSVSAELPTVSISPLVKAGSASGQVSASRANIG
jgi:hypothetical protein